MNWLHCFWGVSITLSPIIMSYSLAGDSGSWQNGYRVFAISPDDTAKWVLLYYGGIMLVRIISGFVPVKAQTIHL